MPAETPGGAAYPLRYIPVPVREDRLVEVFRVLGTKPAGGSTAPVSPGPASPAPNLVEADDDGESVQEAERDDTRWDAFWSVRDNVEEHLAQRSDLVHAILRSVAEHANGDDWVTTDQIAADIDESPSRVASALGPLGRYLMNRDLGWPMRWRYREHDGRVEMKMVPEEAALILDLL
jgi:hypothetical protein